jgi:intracellular sulfur oxidation DsrE/DsrF family protein
MKRHLIPSSLLVAAMIGFGFNSVASASDYSFGFNSWASAAGHKCPVGLLDGSTTLNMEFGPGTKRRTKCIRKRTKVKVMVQIHKFCRDEWNSAGDRVLKITDCDPGRAYALHNIDNMLNDFEITHGMRPGQNFEVVAVVHGEGNSLLVKDGYRFNDTVKGEVYTDNPYQSDVEALMDRGVRFLFCQNATRTLMSYGMLPSYMEGEGSATDALIPGVEYITAGMTAMADLQSRGYSYIRP